MALILSLILFFLCLAYVQSYSYYHYSILVYVLFVLLLHTYLLADLLK